MDSNRSRVRARERRRADQANALQALADALNQLDAAQQGVDDALVTAMDLHTPAHDVRELLELKPATFWRRVRAAREAVGQ